MAAHKKHSWSAAIVEDTILDKFLLLSEISETLFEAIP